MMNTEGRPQGCVSYQPDAEYQTSEGDFPEQHGSAVHVGFVGVLDMA